MVGGDIRHSRVTEFSWGLRCTRVAVLDKFFGSHHIVNVNLLGL